MKLMIPKVYRMLFPALSLLASSVLAQSLPTDEPRIACSAATYDFGRVGNTASVMHVFLVVNEGNAPLTITSVDSGCGCTVAKSGANAIDPGSTTDVTVKFDTSNRVGAQRKAIYVRSNDHLDPILRLELTGELFDVPRFSQPAAPLIPVAVTDVTGVVRSLPSHQDVGRIKADLYAIPSEVSLVAWPGHTNAVCRYVAIRSRSGKSFRIERVELPDAGMAVHPESALNGGYRCEIQNIVPTTNFNDHVIVIHTDCLGESAVAIPIRVVEKHTGA